MKIVFSEPKKTPFIIFDCMSADRIKLLLEGMNLEFVELEARREKLYFSFKILFRFILTLFRFPIRFKLVHLYDIYLLSLIEHIDPKVVVTFIDNSVRFQKISRLYRGNAKFIAVQNGIKCINYVVSKTELPHAILPPKGVDGHKISFPIFYCWGKFEEDLYKKYGHQVDRYECAGPLVAQYFVESLQSKEESKKEFDVLVISQFASKYFSNQTPLPYDEQIKLDMLVLLKNYSESHSLKIAVAARTASLEEETYFRKHLGSEMIYFKNERKALSTYHLMNRAHVMCSWHSAAAYEAYYLEKKVLFFNTINEKYSGHSDIEETHIINMDPLLFEKKLNNLMQMPIETYLKITQKDRDYRFGLKPIEGLKKFRREFLI